MKRLSRKMRRRHAPKVRVFDSEAGYVSYCEKMRGRWVKVTGVRQHGQWTYRVEVPA